MDGFTAKHIRTRAAAAASDMDDFKSLYDECYRFAMPNHARSQGGGRSGLASVTQLYDNTAVISTQNFANKIKEGMFPAYSDWCRLVVGTETDFPDDDEGKKAIETVNDQLDKVRVEAFRAIRQTQFDQAAHEWCMELAVGTAVMQIMPGDLTTPVRFTTVPLSSISFEEGVFGNPQNVYRKQNIAFDDIIELWPDADISEDMKMRYQSSMDGVPVKVDILEATMFDKSQEEYCYYVLLDNGEEGDDGHIMVSRKMDVSPWVICRYSKAAGETLGRGPLTTVLSEMANLNELKYLTLNRAAMDASGVFTFKDEGSFNPNSFDLKPGLLVPVTSNSGSDPCLKRLDLSANMDLSLFEQKDLQEAIRRALLDETLSQDSVQPISATEVYHRMQRQAVALGSSYSRILNEGLEAAFRRILYVLEHDMKLISLHGLKVNNRDIGIVPVAYIASTLNAGVAQQVVEFTQLAASFGPEGASKVDKRKAVDFIAEKMSIPMQVLNSSEKVDMILNEMQQQMQQQAMQQQAPIQEQATSDPEGASLDEY